MSLASVMLVAENPEGRSHAPGRRQGRGDSYKPLTQRGFAMYLRSCLASAERCRADQAVLAVRRAQNPLGPGPRQVLPPRPAQAGHRLPDFTGGACLRNPGPGDWGAILAFRA